MFIIINHKLIVYIICFFFSSRRRHTRCSLVTGVQTCALPISTASADSLGGSAIERINDPHIMDKLLATLEPREEQIVRLRIGGPEGEAQTQRTVASVVGLSPGSIGQIEAKAYRRMRWVMNNLGTDAAVLDALIAKRNAEIGRAHV